MSENNRIEEIIYEVFSLYENRGGENYIGERVTQLEHATQCAMLAEQEGYSDDVSNLGTLLHTCASIARRKCEPSRDS